MAVLVPGIVVFAVQTPGIVMIAIILIVVIAVLARSLTQRRR
jgi:hypothetical protein